MESVRQFYLDYQDTTAKKLYRHGGNEVWRNGATGHAERFHVCYRRSADNEGRAAELAPCDLPAREPALRPIPPAPLTVSGVLLALSLGLLATWLVMQFR